MLTWHPLIVATAVPFRLTRQLMNGALGFWKIGWMEPENWFWWLRPVVVFHGNTKDCLE